MEELGVPLHSRGWISPSAEFLGLLSSGTSACCEFKTSKLWQFYKKALGVEIPMQAAEGAGHSRWARPTVCVQAP